jgi:hypothetical protein
MPKPMRLPQPDDAERKDLHDATYGSPNYLGTYGSGEEKHDVYLYRDAQGVPFEESRYKDGRVVLKTPEDPGNLDGPWRDADSGEVVVGHPYYPPDFAPPLDSQQAGKVHKEVSQWFDDHDSYSDRQILVDAHGIQSVEFRDGMGKRWEVTREPDGNERYRIWDREDREWREPKESEYPSRMLPGSDRPVDPDSPLLESPDTPPDLPPGVELQDTKWLYRDADGRGHYGGVDQYGRKWEWFRDAQGNTKVGYEDGDLLWHETYKQNGFWYETFTDKNGNKHLGQVDEYGNIHDSWTDARTGEVHDEVRVPRIEQEEIRARQEAEEGARAEARYRQPAEEQERAEQAQDPAHILGDAIEENPELLGTLLNDPDLLKDLAEEWGLAPEELKAAAEAAASGQAPDDDETKEGGVSTIPSDPSEEEGESYQTGPLPRNSDNIEVGDTNPSGGGNAIEVGDTSPSGGDNDIGVGDTIPEKTATADAPGGGAESRLDDTDPGRGDLDQTGPPPSGPDDPGEGSTQRPGGYDGSGIWGPWMNRYDKGGQTSPIDPVTQQLGLTEAEQQALREAGLTPEQIEWVQGKTVANDKGLPVTEEALGGLTDRQWEVIDGIWENHRGPVDQQPPPADDDGDFRGMGEPYKDYIPTFPMVKDPATGEWRNAQPGEIPGPGEGDAGQPPPGTQTPEPTPAQPGLTQAEEQALREAGLTPAQIAWVEVRIVDPGEMHTLEDPGFTDQQWELIGGIQDKLAAQTTTPPATEEPGIPRTPEGEDQPQPAGQEEDQPAEAPSERSAQTLKNPDPAPPADTGEPTYWSPMPYRDQDPVTGEWRFKVEDPATGELRDPEPGGSPGPWVPELEILAWRDGVPRPDLNPWTGEKLVDPTTGEPYPDPVADPTTAYETMDIVFVEPDDPRLGTSPRYVNREEFFGPDPISPAPTLEPIPFGGPTPFPDAPAATPPPPSGDAGGGPQEEPPAPDPQPAGQPEDLPADAPGEEAEPAEIPGIEGSEAPTTLPAYPGEEAAAAPPPEGGGAESSGWPEGGTQGDEYAIPEIEPVDPYQQPQPPVDEPLTTEAGWPSFDPSQQQSSWAEEPGGGAEEPAGHEAYHQGFEDPTLTDPGLAEPGVPDEGFDDALGA